MERIIIKSINIIDFTEKKSRKIPFSDGINIVTSDHTSRGKSSILRVIYHSMGANSAYDNVFKSFEKIFEVKFSSGTNEYRIIRYKNKYLVYKNENLVLKSINDYKVLSNFYKEEFGFAVYLTDKNNIFDIAPVTYSFIPYFLDQDRSWKNNIIPFNNTDQFSDDSLINLYYFHLAVLDLNYYKKNMELKTLNNSIKNRIESINSIENVLLEFKKYYGVELISINEENAKINLDLMKKEIDKYLIESNAIQSKIFEIENSKVKLNVQINNIDSLLKEISSKKLKLVNPVINCPKCDNEINLNDHDEFKLNYSIEFLTENKKVLIYEQLKYEEELSRLRPEYIKIIKKIDEITKRYNEQNNLFEKFVKANAVSVIIDEKEKELIKEKEKLVNEELKKNEINNSLNNYKKKKTNVNSDFRETYFMKLQNLGVVNVDKKDIDNFKKVVLSGSQYVRSTLGFFLTFLKLKKVYNEFEFSFPLVIDSPFEGDQDDFNKNDIIKEILDYYNEISNQQIIIGMREAEQYINKENKTPINIIKLNNDKGSLLQKEEYIKNIEEINAIVKIIVG